MLIFKNCINCTLLFCPFDAPLVKPPQWFPASYNQKKDNNMPLNGSYFLCYLQNFRIKFVPKVKWMVHAQTAVNVLVRRSTKKKMLKNLNVKALMLPQRRKEGKEQEEI